jgi:hypothetical protein
MVDSFVMVPPLTRWSRKRNTAVIIQGNRAAARYYFVSVARYRQFSAPKEKFPWLLFLVLLAAIGLFFVLPRQIGTSQIQVEFTAPQ